MLVSPGAEPVACRNRNLPETLVDRQVNGHCHWLLAPFSGPNPPRPHPPAKPSLSGDPLMKALTTFTLSTLAAAISLSATAGAIKDEPITPIRPPQSINLGMVELGKKLYFDPRLSNSGFISCNSCHGSALIARIA